MKGKRGQICHRFIEMPDSFFDQLWSHRIDHDLVMFGSVVFGRPSGVVPFAECAVCVTNSEGREWLGSDLPRKGQHCRRVEPSRQKHSKWNI